MRNIQVLKPVFRVNEVLEEIRQCLEKGWTGIGFKTVELEKQWSKYTGFKYAHFLNSSTSGLHLAVKLLKAKGNWKKNDEVITTSLTFVSTNHAILYEGLIPKFCEVDESLCMNPISARAAITSKTRAIMYVGIGGSSSNYRAIKSIADEFGLILILDAAHMSGTRWLNSGEHVGLDADCTIFSFQAVKNCPSSDSGMICFNDADLDYKVRSQSWLGIDKSTYERFSQGSYKWRYDVTDLGYKYNGNSIAAAITLVSLKYLDEDNLRRREIVDLYVSLLSNTNNLSIVHHDVESCSSRHLFQIIVPNRDSLIDFLATKSIFCGVHYIPNHLYAVYKKFGAQLPITETLGSQIISLPLHLELLNEDIHFICTQISAFQNSL